MSYHPFTNVLEYIPKKYVGLSSKQLQDRNAVYAFKDGNCPLYAKEQLASCIKDVVSSDPSASEESVRLFKQYKDVAKVAQTRGLTEGTIYNHLFSTETLDPHDYISDHEYERAVRIYEEGHEHPAAMLDEFLDIAVKAAFYYLRRKENGGDSQAEVRRAALINVFDDDD